MVVPCRFALVFLVLAAVTGTAHAQRGTATTPAAKQRVPVTRAAQSIPRFAALTLAPDQAALQDKAKQSRQRVVDLTKLTEADRVPSIKSVGNLNPNASIFLSVDPSPLSVELSASKPSTQDAYLNFISPAKVDNQADTVTFKQQLGIVQEDVGEIYPSLGVVRLVKAEAGCELGFKVQKGKQYYVKVEFLYGGFKTEPNALAAPLSDEKTITYNLPLYAVDSGGSAFAKPFTMQWIVDAPNNGWLGYYLVLEKPGEWALKKITVKQVEL